LINQSFFKLLALNGKNSEGTVKKTGDKQETNKK
jgi:hypothetical protein